MRKENAAEIRPYPDSLGKQANTLYEGENAILEMIIEGAPLVSILRDICHLYERLISGSRCSILLLGETGRYLEHGASPSLPAKYVAAINGVAIGLGVGSCGTGASVVHECGQG